jgi:hypothetical protein
MDDLKSDLLPARELDAPLLPRLYSLKHIMWASVVGGPLAGTWMVATNFRRLGEGKKSLVTSLIGGSTVALVVVLAFALERSFGKTGTLRLGAVLGISAYLLAKRFQGRAITTHAEQEGPFESPWKSLAVTVVSVVVAIVAAGSLESYLRPTVVVGGSHEIELGGTATESDAIRVGEVLTEIGMFRYVQHTRMRVAREPSRWIVTVGVKQGSLEDAEVLKSFEAIANALRARAFADNLKLRMVLTTEGGLKTKTCDLGEGGRLTCR